MTTGIERLRAAFRPGRPAVVAYLPVGDPLAFDARIPDAYREAGIGVLEVGIPTRSAWLDGPEVTASMGRALDVGTHPTAIAAAVTTWRTGPGSGAPDERPAVAWFSYPDLPLSVIETAAGTGAIDGLLLLEPWRHPEADRVPQLLADLRLAACSFLPWDPTDADLAAVQRATGYVMVQARPGVTGADAPAGVPVDAVRLARTLAPGIPVVAGFGVRDGATARAALASGADGVVVGSAAIRAAVAGGADGVRDLLAGIVGAVS